MGNIACSTGDTAITVFALATYQRFANPLPARLSSLCQSANADWGKLEARTCAPHEYPTTIRDTSKMCQIEEKLNTAGNREDANGGGNL